MDSPNTSPLDRHKYELLRLPNDLLTLLVSASEMAAQFSHGGDEERLSNDNLTIAGANEDNDIIQDFCKEKLLATVAIAVEVGSFNDPVHLPGLTSLLARTVLVASERFPGHHELKQFVSKNGGNIQTFVDFDKSVFKLTTSVSSFKQAVQMLVLCLTQPAITAESMKDPLSEIQKEFTEQSMDKDCRYHRLISSLAYRQHPVRRLVIGDSRLYKASRGDLKAHFQRYYSARFMKAVVYSPESLYGLQNWVEQLFSVIPNQEQVHPTPDLSIPPFSPFETSDFTKMYHVNPRLPRKELVLTWSFGGMKEYYRQKPLRIIEFILDYKGDGSVTSILRQKKWAVAVFARRGENGNGDSSVHTLLTIRVELTEAGTSNLLPIITMIFEYIKALNNKLHMKKVYENLKNVAIYKFDWLCSTVIDENRIANIAADLLFCHPADCLTCRYLYTEYDEVRIYRCLDYLIPENMNIFHYTNQDNPGHSVKEEPLFGIMYTVSPIPNEWIEKWDTLKFEHLFFMPIANQYVVTDFELKSTPSTFVPCATSTRSTVRTRLVAEDDKSYPLLVDCDRQNNLWHKHDTSFKVPQAYIYYHFVSPLSRGSPQSTVLCDLFIAILNILFREKCYYASISGLSFAISKDSSGVELKISGFNQHVPLLLETILDIIRKFDVDEDLFQAIRQTLSDDYHYSIMDSLALAHHLRIDILEHRHWNPLDRYLIIARMTREFLLLFAKNFISMSFLEGLIVGNITKKEALSLHQMVKERLGRIKALFLPIPDLRVRKLEKGTKFCRVRSFHEYSSEIALVNYYQTGPGDDCNLLLHTILVALMKQPIRLAQRYQGIFLHCDFLNTFGVFGLSISVRSSKDQPSCTYLDRGIEGFLQTFGRYIERLDPCKFESVKRSLIREKTRGFQTLQDEVEAYWKEVYRFNYAFDRMKREVECLKNLKLEDLLEFTKKHILKCGNEYRKLAIQVIGVGAEASMLECKDITKPCQRYDVSDYCYDQGQSGDFACDSQTVKDWMQADRIVCEKTLYHLVPESGPVTEYIEDIQNFKNSLGLYPVTYL